MNWPAPVGPSVRNAGFAGLFPRQRRRISRPPKASALNPIFSLMSAVLEGRSVDDTGRIADDDADTTIMTSACLWLDEITNGRNQPRFVRCSHSAATVPGFNQCPKGFPGTVMRGSRHRDLPTPAKNDLTPYQFGWVNGTRRDEQAFCCPFCLDGVGAHRLRRHNRMAVVSTQHN